MIDSEDTLDDVAEHLTDGLAAGRKRRNRAEDLMSALPFAWRAGRLHGPTVNVVPFLGTTVGGWTTEVAAWGPVEDCMIIVSGDPDTDLCVTLTFNPDLYSAAEAREHTDRLTGWLGRVLTDPGRRLDVVGLLTDDERAVHAALAGPAATDPAPSAPRWGEPTTAADLAAAAGRPGARVTVTVGGFDAPFGRPGVVTVSDGAGTVDTGLLAAPTPEGLVFRGLATDRVPVPGGYVELGEVRAVAGRAGVEFEVSVRRGVRVTLYPGAGDDGRALAEQVRAAMPPGVSVRLA
ncbi:hypothetical protein [Tsukamurella soli]|uniref:hypothetical protein n=1 Tax=Tsukamurella soli TaxID=644556 RepID=UPI00361EA49F